METKKPFADIETKEGRHYVCVSENQPFKIAAFSGEEEDENVYAAILYLDGKRVFGNKTFKGKGVWHGFRCGPGRFQMFTFSNPPEATGGEEPIQEEANLSDHDGADGGDYRPPESLGAMFGTIHVKFFSTRSIPRTPRPEGGNGGGGNPMPSFQQAGREADKKMMYRSVSVKAGEEFEMEGFGGGAADPPPAFNNDDPPADTAAWGEPTAAPEGEAEAEAPAWGADPSEEKKDEPAAGAAWGEEPDANMIEPKPAEGEAAWGDEPAGDNAEGGDAGAGGGDWGTGGGEEGETAAADEPNKEDMREVGNFRDGPVDECTIYYADLTALRL